MGIDLFSYQPPPGPSQREQGEAGMAAAVEHAERVASGWKQEASHYLRRFAREHRERGFLAEEIAPWAYQQGCTMPPDGRAWGAIIQQARRAGVIEHTGAAALNQLSGHDSTWRPVWRTGPNAN